MLRVIASGPHWHPKEILQAYQQCQICCFDHVLICERKFKSFMFYWFATTCIYVNSSFVEFPLIV